MANLSYGVSGSSYYDLARQGRVFAAFAAAVTGTVIYSTAAGTGGPLLWNGSASAPTPVNAVILAASAAITTASAADFALGLTGNSGQSSAPSSTTAITTVQNLLIGGVAPACTAYKVGTPSSAGDFFLPLINITTAALTTIPIVDDYVDLAGAVVVPPGAWVSLAGSATGTTSVLQCGLVWAEIPVSGY